MHIMQSRRDFLAGLSAAGAASVLGSRTSLAVEGPPEVTTLRIMKQPGVCLAPQFVAEELLGAEGFTDVRYISTPGYAGFDGVTRGEIDFAWDTAARVVTHVDAGVPITALAGVHSGCYELFAHEPIRTISDLKGKRVGISNWGGGGHLFLTVMVAHIGLDPDKDIKWVTPGPTRTPMQLFAERQADAFLGFAPEPQELRARKIGHAILNMATDKPWSQYFCCTVFGNRDFVRAHPIATKRYLRAILKAADICAAEPERVARQLVDEGVTDQYDYALQTLTEVPYKVWREFDQEDSMRFYALRLREVDMIKSTPNEILAQGTDWRFLNELKRELKA
jgi:NitT/TauT family transport system substrate-binding protein